MTANNLKAHTQYKLKNGTLVAGVTTVLQVLNKPFLVEWAYKCGRDGLDIHKIRENSADIGTLSHYLILCDLKGETPYVKDYSANDMVVANTCLNNYHVWKKQHDLKILMVETPLISEKFAYGGTLDLYAELDGKNVLIDFKTSGGLYQDYIFQCAAYSQLILEETGKSPDAINLVRIPKSNKESFETKYLTSYDKYFDVFRHCLCIYQLQKELK